MKKTVVFAIIIAFGLTLMNCGGSGKTVMMPCKDAPDWVYQGGSAFSKKDKAFYGVGSVSNITSPSLRRTTADQRARADLARVFSTKVKDLTKFYEQSVSSGNIPGAESMEQYAQNVMKAFTEMDLAGAEIVDHYFCPSENAMYSLAKLDVDAFKDQIEKVKALPEQVKQSIIDNANAAFEELDNQ